MSLEPGTRLGPYEVIGRLGAGGMGEVYRARDTRLGRDVALKVLPLEASRDGERLRRFVSEAKTVSALNHPNILTLHEIGESANGPYLVTEIVDGETIRARILRGPIPLTDALEIAAQTAEGLTKAHEAGIVHRDVKPENLMRTRDGYVKILDFGLAKLRTASDSTILGMDTNVTASGVIVGTPAYMSPEQLRGLQADARSDLFALGVVLHEMLGGRNPFRRESAAGTISAILTEDPPALDSATLGVPRAVAQVAYRLTAKDPSQRPTSAREVAVNLREILATESVARTAVAAPTRRTRRAFAIGAAIAAAGVLSVFLLKTRTESGVVDSGRPRSGARSFPGPAGFPMPSMPAASVELPKGRIGVAVLPIRDESGDPVLAEANIGRILTDAFVQVLSDVPPFYVASPLRLDGVARSLGRSFSDAATDLQFARRLCEEANAQAVLSGSLARVGSTYVFQATLTELGSERLLESFRAESKDAENLLVNVTKGFTEQLRTKYMNAEAGEGGAMPEVATGSLDAYAEYVRASEATFEGNWDQAIEALNRTIAMDPNMALAWSELACAYSFAGDEPRSIAALRKAQSLIDHVNHKERRWIELNALWVDGGNGPRYVEEAKKYIEDFPDDRQGYFYAGLGFEYLFNDPNQALEYYEKAFTLTPNYYSISKAIVDCHLKLGHPRDGVAALERYLAIPFAGSHGRELASWRLEELEKGA